MSTHEEVTRLLAEVKAKVPPEMEIEIPPKVIVDMQGEFLSYDPQAMTLRARFPIMARYLNPLGFVQGGILAALVDNTIGPLSFLVAPPSVTTQLNTTYIRPVSLAEGYVEVEGQVTEMTKRQIFLTGRLLNPGGKTCVVCHSSCMIL
ncbi:MAG: hypothetical protein OHK0046_35720 [Anaerolineae bacterium]